MGQYVFKLPDVGEGTAEAEIVAWHVRVGDMVAEDAPLVDVMTDKATVEMTAPVSGRIVSIQGEPGDMAAVGSAIAVFETEAEASSDRASPDAQADLKVRAPNGAPSEPKPRIKVPAGAMAPGTAPAPKPPTPPPAPSQAVARPSAREPAVRETALREMGPSQAPPAVRARAQKLGVDLAQVRGTGP